MKTVFLDTVGLIAILDDRDQWHDRAVDAYKILLGENGVMLTTEAVFLECGNAASRLKQRPLVSMLRKRFITEERILIPFPEEVEDAWLKFEQGAVGSAGIVDKIPFQVMKRLGILEAFTNDQHFRTAGFVTLF